MVRQSAGRLATAALLASAVLLLCACGIKGPLSLPPRDTAKPVAPPPGPAIPAIPDATTLPPDTRGNTAP